MPARDAEAYPSHTPLVDCSVLRSTRHRAVTTSSQTRGRSLSWGVWLCSSPQGNHHPAAQERLPPCGTAHALLRSSPTACPEVVIHRSCVPQCAPLHTSDMPWGPQSPLSSQLYVSSPRRQQEARQQRPTLPTSPGTTPAGERWPALDNALLTGEAEGQSSRGHGCGMRFPLRQSTIAEPPAVMGAQEDGRTVTAMALDLILRNARLASTGPEQPTVDIGVQHGRIVAIEPHLTAEGLPTWREAGVGDGESHFTSTRRGSSIACRSSPTGWSVIIWSGRRPLSRPSRQTRCTHGRKRPSSSVSSTGSPICGRRSRSTHNVGLLGFEVIEQLRRDYAWAIDLQPCVFLQEGWTDARC